MHEELQHKSDEALMVLIQNHQSSLALSEIHRRYSQKLMSYFYRMLNRDEQLAQDFVQDIFVKIIEKHHLFDSNKKLSAWIFTIACNMCKTHFRSFGKSEELDLSKHSKMVFSTDRFSELDFKKQLDLSLSRMEEVHKSVLVLRYLDEFSLNEISEILDISLGTVKSRLFYATQKITKDLQDYNPVFQQNVFKLI